jgi:DNA-directed RNA polymerase subunit M
MKFCSICGSILTPKEVDGTKFLGCSCGYVYDKGTSIVKFGDKKNTRDIEIAVEVVEKSDAPYVIVEEACPQCDNNEAEHWTQQVGPSDEPEANIFKCTKCGYSWRDTHHY